MRCCSVFEILPAMKDTIRRCEVEDEGARFENLVACHLIKAVEMWTDLGLGDYALYYVRNKAKAEVEFLVAKNGKPWFLVEAKTEDTKISSALISMQKITGGANTGGTLACNGR